MDNGNNYNNLTYIPQPNSQSHTSKTLPMPGRSHEESIELEKLNGCSMEMNNNGLINQPTPEELFFDNKYIGFNQWIEIPEPVRLFFKIKFYQNFFQRKTRIDRSASSLIKVQKAVIATNGKKINF
jgi:hypothetical protein